MFHNDDLPQQIKPGSAGGAPGISIFEQDPFRRQIIMARHPHHLQSKIESLAHNLIYWLQI
jgi:hypothetical protein